MSRNGRDGSQEGDDVGGRMPDFGVVTGPWQLRPEYFAIMGEVPTDVARVLLQIPGLAPLNAPVTDGWFVTVAAQKVNGPVPETYLDASGAPIGSGTWNGGETTC